MKEVVLVAMKMANFKGVSNLEVSFGTITNVSGANGTGKTTLYDAYMWCLFGKGADGSSIDVQPLDASGKVIHRIETSVEVTLSVDGEEVIVKRCLNENWVKPRGQQEEVLKGRTTEFWWNGSPIPLSDSSKIDAICKSEDWLMLSTITAFMRMKTEDRRAKLQSIAKIQTDEEIAAGYPHVLTALHSGKTVGEYQRQVKSELERVKDKAKEIPTRLDQLDKTKVDYDFDALEKEEVELKEKIDDLNASLAATVTQSDVDRAAKFRSELASVGQQLLEIENEIDRARQKRIGEFEEKISKSNAAIAGYSKSIAEIDERIGRNKKLLDEKKAEFNQKQAEWMKENQTQYVDTVEAVCPTCNRPLPEEEVAEARERAIQAFNARHNKLLDDLYADAERINGDIKMLEQSIQQDRQERNRIDIMLKNEKEILKAAETGKKNVPERSLALAAKEEYQKLLTKKGEIERDIRLALAPTATDTEREEKRKNLVAQRDEYQARQKDVHLKLGQRETNKNIDKQKAALEEEKKALSQKTAELEMVQDEIWDFKKRKITIVEEAVSSFFKIVRWRMFEQNLTNDGEKELCEAIIDGKPYGTQNLAMQMNAGIDIINGISSALGVRLPLFIDQKESVTDLIETETQLITLEVTAGSKLNISIIKN